VASHAQSVQRPVAVGTVSDDCLVNDLPAGQVEYDTPCAQLCLSRCATTGIVWQKGLPAHVVIGVDRPPRVAVRQVP